MKKLSVFFIVLSIIISDIMCATVAFNYRDILCGTEHAGYSANANVAFLYAVPFLVIIFALLITAYILHKKS